jgi:hypothetical protein
MAADRPGTITGRVLDASAALTPPPAIQGDLREPHDGSIRSSLLTRRWREMDSNHRFPDGSGASIWGTEQSQSGTRSGLEIAPIFRGTGSSNPSRSSGESGANLTFGARSSPTRKSRQFTSTTAATTYGVNTGVAIWSPSIGIRSRAPIADEGAREDKKERLNGVGADCAWCRPRPTAVSGNSEVLRLSGDR